MPDLTPRQLILCGLALLGLALFAVVYAGRGDGVAASPRPAYMTASTASPSSASPQRISWRGVSSGMPPR